MYRILRWVIILYATALCVSASTFSFQGVFQTDDQIQQFSFTEAAPLQVTMKTFGYAGGVNGNGQPIPEGGFDPFLSLFDSGGNLVAENDDGGCGNVNKDSQSGGCADSFIQQTLAAGTYTLVLTQTGNEPAGTTLSAGFSEQGQGNYTCGGGFGNFCDPSTYTDRTGHWAVDISGVGVITAVNASVPEPKSFLLLCAASFLFAIVFLRRFRSKA